MTSRTLAAATAIWVLVSACALPSGGGVASAPPSETRAAPKRLTSAIRGTPNTLYQKLNPRSNIAGINSLERLVNTGLTVPSPDGVGRLARLSEAVPTVENGLWKLLPDGGMNMTWTIRPGVTWHDGAPLTADDLVFTVQAARDKSLPIFDHVAYGSLGTVEALDSHTVVARWTKPYINADQLFSFEIALPFPKHLLEATYASDREHLLDHPYWGSDFIGTGPYRVKAWELGSHLVFAANDQYLLGRPKIDEIVVKFIADPDTLAANLLAGEIDTVWGGRIDIEWARSISDQWKAGRLETNFQSMIQIFVQFINPTPPIIAQSPDFRRAMVHALDRQSMVDILRFGLTSVGHTFVNPQEPEYPAIEPAIVKYDYDPRRALALLESVGYTRGSDGGLRHRSGQRLGFQLRTSQGDVRQENALYAASDNWQQLGVEVERHFVPPQRANDAEYRATFPAFDIKGQAGTMDYATSFHSRGIALPDNNYLVSGNNSRYSNAAMDVAVDKYFTTIPWEERMAWGRQVVHILSDEVGWIGLYYDVAALMLPDRVVGRGQARTEQSALDFIHQWDVKG